MAQKKLCIFLHYFPGGYYPIYIQYYLNELCLYFDEVRMVTNRREIERTPELMNKDILIQQVDNEGYDFGMFYKAFQEIDPSEYDQIACINDSNILFGELKTFLKWGNNQQVDFWGLVDSNEAPWFSSHSNNYHIQSHFLVFNEKAINSLPDFFKELDVKTIYGEKDTKKLRRFIVDQWEIGLSQFLLNRGLTSASYFNSLALISKYHSKGKNVTHTLYQELIKEGYPLLKKKVVLKKSWRSFFGREEPWEKLIREYASNQHNIPLLINDIKSLASK
jgi:lipopolysaccharide biosynthesis protein